MKRLKDEFEPKDIRFSRSPELQERELGELLYYVSDRLAEIEQEPVIFQQEYFPEEELLYENLPYTVTKEEDVYVVEGPKIEKMLGYTNLDSERDLPFSRSF